MTQEKQPDSIKMASTQHEFTKELAKSFLKVKGFCEHEIYFEYFIKISDIQSRRIDVVGIKDLGNYKIAIEVGKLNGGPIEQLKPFFNEVYHFDFFNHERLEEILMIVNSLKNENAYLNEKVLTLSKENNKMYNILSNNKLLWELNDEEDLWGQLDLDKLTGLDLETAEGKEIYKDLMSSNNKDISTQEEVLS